GPSLIHAWTPRELVRKQTESMVKRLEVPYVTHLEDNEDAITGTFLGVGPEEVAALPEERLAGVPESLAHPGRSRSFIAEGRGVTLVIDQLGALGPPGVPRRVISPAYEQELFQPQEPDPDLRARLGLRVDDDVIVYAGNVHESNAGEVRSLYLAVAL